MCLIESNCCRLHCTWNQIFQLVLSFYCLFVFVLFCFLFLFLFVLGFFCFVCFVLFCFLPYIFDAISSDTAVNIL